MSSYNWNEFKRTFKSYPSPNFRKGRLDHAITAVVIHIMDGWQGADNGLSGTRYWFSLSVPARNAELHKRWSLQDPKTRTPQPPRVLSASSSHYGVGRAGVVDVYVPEENEAWHAGVVNQQTWVGLKRNQFGKILNPNIYTIGIEHEGFASGPNKTAEFSNEQYEATSKLVASIAARHQFPINLNTVIPHSLLDPINRKHCPSTACDVPKLIEMARGWKVEL